MGQAPKQEGQATKQEEPIKIAQEKKEVKFQEQQQEAIFVKPKVVLKEEVNALIKNQFHRYKEQFKLEIKEAQPDTTQNFRPLSGQQKQKKTKMQQDERKMFEESNKRRLNRVESEDDFTQHLQELEESKEQAAYKQYMCNVITRNGFGRAKQYWDPFPFLSLRKKLLFWKAFISHTCLQIIRHQLFDIAMLLVVLINSIELATDDPTTDVPTAIQEKLEIFFIIAYTTEMALKIFGLGFFFNKNAYIKDSWNIIDFIIVISAYLPFFMSGSAANSVSGLRALRVLRPMRTISYIKELNKLVTAIIRALPLIKDALILLSFFYMIFAIIGSEIYSGMYKKRCFNSNTGIIQLPQYQTDERQVLCVNNLQCNGQHNGICGKMISNPMYGIYNFDTFPSAFLNIFIVVTMENWTDIENYAVQTLSIFSRLFFVLTTIIGAFFLTNITLAIISVMFEQSQKDDRIKYRSKSEKYITTTEFNFQKLKKFKLLHGVRKEVQMLKLTRFIQENHIDVWSQLDSPFMLRFFQNMYEDIKSYKIIQKANQSSVNQKLKSLLKIRQDSQSGTQIVAENIKNIQMLINKKVKQIENQIFGLTREPLAKQNQIIPQAISPMHIREKIFYMTTNLAEKYTKQQDMQKLSSFQQQINNAFDEDQQYLLQFQFIFDQHTSDQIKHLPEKVKSAICKYQYIVNQQNQNTNSMQNIKLFDNNLKHNENQEELEVISPIQSQTQNENHNHNELKLQQDIEMQEINQKIQELIPHSHPQTPSNQSRPGSSGQQINQIQFNDKFRRLGKKNTTILLKMNQQQKLINEMPIYVKLTDLDAVMFSITGADEDLLNESINDRKERLRFLKNVQRHESNLEMNVQHQIPYKSFSQDDIYFAKSQQNAIDELKRQEGELKKTDYTLFYWSRQLATQERQSRLIRRKKNRHYKPGQSSTPQLKQPTENASPQLGKVESSMFLSDHFSSSNLINIQSQESSSWGSKSSIGGSSRFFPFLRETVISRIGSGLSHQESIATIQQRKPMKRIKVKLAYLLTERSRELKKQMKVNFIRLKGQQSAQLNMLNQNQVSFRKQYGLKSKPSQNLSQSQELQIQQQEKTAFQPQAQTQTQKKSLFQQLAHKSASQLQLLQSQRSQQQSASALNLNNQQRQSVFLQPLQLQPQPSVSLQRKGLKADKKKKRQLVLRQVIWQNQSFKEAQMLIVNQCQVHYNLEELKNECDQLLNMNVPEKERNMSLASVFKQRQIHDVKKCQGKKLNVYWSGEDIIYPQSKHVFFGADFIETQKRFTKRAITILKSLNFIKRDYDLWEPHFNGKISYFRRKCKYLQASQFFTNFILLIVVINTTILALQGIEEGYSTAIINLVCTYMFMIEMAIKLIGLGVKGYTRDRMNIFDALIVIMSVFELSLTNNWAAENTNSKTAVSAFRVIKIFRVFRVLRVARLIRSLRYMKIIMSVLSQALDTILYTVLLLILFLFIYTLLGMQMYGGTMPFSYDDPLANRQNFDTFYDSFMAVFQIMTIENWPQLLAKCYRSSGVPYFVTIFFIVSWIFIGNYTLLNLFLGVLLDGFGAELEGNQDLFADMIEEEDKENMGSFSEMDPFSVNNALGQSKQLLQQQQLGESKGENWSTQKQNENESQSSLQIDFNQNGKEDLQAKIASFSKDPMEMLDSEEEEEEELAMQKKKKPFVYFQNVDCLDAFFIIPQSSWIRQKIYYLVNQKFFDKIIICVIVISSLKLVVDTYIEDTPNLPQNTLQSALSWIDIAITVVFAIEAFLKMIALGFFMNKNSYLRNNWNKLDFIIVVLSLLDIMLSSQNLQFIKVIRLMRVLRPLRFVTHNKNMKIVVISLMESLGGLVNVLIVMVLVWLMFAIFGVNLLGDELGACAGLDNNYGISKAQCEVWQQQDTTNSIFWNNEPQNLDNVYRAMITLFVFTTLEGWPDTYYLYADANDSSTGPIQSNKKIIGLYFVFFILVGSFFLLNLFIGVIAMNYEMAEKKSKNKYMTEDQMRWVEMQRMVADVTPDYNTLKQPKNKFRHFLWKLQQSIYFEQAIMLVIVLNIISMVLNYETASDSYRNKLSQINQFCTYCFVLEAIIKNVALGPQGYFYYKWNCFDMFVVVSSVLDIILEMTGQAAFLQGAAALTKIFRVLRVMRLLKLVRSLSGLFSLVETILFALPALMNVMSLTFLVYFIFSVLAVFLFKNIGAGRIINDNDMNFRNFGNSLHMLYRQSTGEDWHRIMYDTMRTDNCTPNVDCGHGYHAIFFLLFIVITVFIMYNLFILVIISNFEQCYINPENPLKKFKSIALIFKNRWNEHTAKSEGLTLQENCLVDFLLKLPEPMGYDYDKEMEQLDKVKEKNAIEQQRNKMRRIFSMKQQASKTIMKMRMISDERGNFHFNELLFAVVKNAYWEQFMGIRESTGALVENPPTITLEQMKLMYKAERKTILLINKKKRKAIESLYRSTRKNREQLQTQTSNQNGVNQESSAVLSQRRKAIYNPVYSALFNKMVFLSWLNFSKLQKLPEEQREAQMQERYHVDSEDESAISVDESFSSSSSSKSTENQNQLQNIDDKQQQEYTHHHHQQHHQQIDNNVNQNIQSFALNQQNIEQESDLLLKKLDDRLPQEVKQHITDHAKKLLLQQSIKNIPQIVNFSAHNTQQSQDQTSPNPIINYNINTNIVINNNFFINDPNQIPTNLHSTQQQIIQNSTILTQNFLNDQIDSVVSSTQQNLLKQ